MIEKYGLFDSVEGDEREYAEADFARLCRALGRDGVRGSEQGLQVSAAPAGLAVTVAAGLAMVQGRYYALEDDGSGARTLNLTAAQTYPRIDRIVLALDFGARTVSLAALCGEEAAQPVPPALTRDAGMYMLSLAQVRVGVGAASLGDEDVTDERADEALCGLFVASADEALAAAQMASASAQGAIWAAQEAQETADGAAEAAAEAKESANRIAGGAEGALVSLDAEGRMVASSRTVASLGTGATYTLSGTTLTITTL